MAVVIKRVDLSDDFAVLIKTTLNQGRGKLLSLSAGGAYVATSMSLLPQAQVRLKIVLRETKRTFEVAAMVNWENQGANSRSALPPGYGVRFTDLDSAGVEGIRAILKSAVVPSIPERPAKKDPAVTWAKSASPSETAEFVVETLPKEESSKICPTCGK